LRTLYTLLFVCLLPLIVLRLKLKARANPDYGKRMAERFALIPQRESNKPCLWVHAVSVGESIAATPIIRALQAKHPEWDVCITTTTPTGSDRIQAAFGDTVLHYYMPYDIPSLVNQFLRRIKPDLFMVIETELWPNTLALCHQKSIPVLLANGRLSAKSAKAYSRVYPLVKEMLGHITFIAAQAPADARRFRFLGAPKARLDVTGSVKFDVSINKQVMARVDEMKAHLQIDPARKVVVFASTHGGEDELILPMIKRLHVLDDKFLAIIVPRHLERFDVVYDLASAIQLDTLRLSEKTAVTPSTQLILGDTMGDMLAIYGLADVAFIGGSLIHHGGHNYLEAAAWKLPILTGISTFNFQTISGQLRKAGGLFIGADAVEIEHKLEAWLKDPQDLLASGERAFAVCEKNRGVLPRLITITEDLMASRS